MALCKIVAGGGGGVKETTLWTNSSPTSSFASQSVPLSSDYTVFDTIRFYYYANTSSSEELCVEYATAYVQNSTASTNGKPYAVLSSYDNGGNARGITHSSNTSLNFAQVMYINSGNTNVNTKLIPTKICGVRY